MSREVGRSLGFLLCVAAALGSVVACGDGAPATSGTFGDAPVLAADAADPVDFGVVPPFELTDQANEPVKLSSLLGRPFVVAAIFTSCAGPCPKITASMRRLQGALEGTDVRLVSVSVDPKTDTPEVLADYAASYTADTTRWMFLTGDEEEIHSFLREGLWLPIARATGEVAPGESVTHSTKLVAVDRRGRLRGWYEGVDADEVAKLEARLHFLASEAP